MIQHLRAAVTAAARPALGLWNRVPMRWQSRVTIALPLLAVAISAGLALLGNIQRGGIETDIQRKFEMNVALGTVTTLMVNAETGMRGYLLTGRDEFLQPFATATDDLPAAMARLTELAEAEPGARPRQDKLARVARIGQLADEQMADLAYQQQNLAGARDAAGSAGSPLLLQHLTHGKSLMDSIRSEVSDMQTEEQSLLDDRIADINAIRARDYISAAIALTVAALLRVLAWYLHRTGTVRRVERLTESVRAMRHGEPAPVAPGKNDTMGELEREIHLLDGRITALPRPAPTAPDDEDGRRPAALPENPVRAMAPAPGPSTPSAVPHNR